jgi:hypothetical protein
MILIIISTVFVMVGCAIRYFIMRYDRMERDLRQIESDIEHLSLDIDAYQNAKCPPAANINFHAIQDAVWEGEE